MSGQHDVSRPASGNHAAGVSDFGPHSFADLLRSKAAAHLVRASAPLAGKSVRKDAIRWSIRRRSLARPAHRSGFRRVPSFRKPSILFAERQ